MRRILFLALAAFVAGSLGCGRGGSYGRSKRGRRTSRTAKKSGSHRSTSSGSGLTAPGTMTPGPANPMNPGGSAAQPSSPDVIRPGLPAGTDIPQDLFYKWRDFEKAYRQFHDNHAELVANKTDGKEVTQAEIKQNLQEARRIQKMGLALEAQLRAKKQEGNVWAINRLHNCNKYLEKVNAAIGSLNAWKE